MSPSPFLFFQLGSHGTHPHTHLYLHLASRLWRTSHRLGVSDMTASPSFQPNKGPEGAFQVFPVPWHTLRYATSTQNSRLHHHNILLGPVCLDAWVPRLCQMNDD